MAYQFTDKQQEAIQVIKSESLLYTTTEFGRPVFVDWDGNIIYTIEHEALADAMWLAAGNSL